jgi:hypothetical protein
MGLPLWLSGSVQDDGARQIAPVTIIQRKTNVDPATRAAGAVLRIAARVVSDMMVSI